MSNKKQTAVEWFKKELENYGSNSHLSLDWNTFDELCQQAKEIEKEQIEDAYSLSRCEWNKIISSSEYYNETYGGNG
jgi:uncharacterized Zn finger protein